MKKLENMLLQLIIGREKAKEKNMTNEKNCIEIMISNLRNDEVTLEELDYRERNGITEAREGWDDRLYLYSTEELEKAEELWTEIA